MWHRWNQWGSRGLEFESRHSDHAKGVKQMFRPFFPLFSKLSRKTGFPEVNKKGQQIRIKAQKSTKKSAGYSLRPSLFFVLFFERIYELYFSKNKICSLKVYLFENSKSVLFMFKYNFDCCVYRASWSENDPVCLHHLPAVGRTLTLRSVLAFFAQREQASSSNMRRSFLCNMNMLLFRFATE